MSGANGSNLQRLEGIVACVRTALNEMFVWHRVALNSLQDLQTELQKNHVDNDVVLAVEHMNKRATSATAAAAAEAAAAEARPEAASGSRRRTAAAARAKEATGAARAARAEEAGEPAPKRAKATSADAVAKKALLAAVQKGNLANVKSFLAVVDPNYFGDEGNTPLHFAAKNCRESILQVLLEKGADVRTTNHSQQTALHAAALADTKGACCELLLRAIEETDAETVNVQDNTHRTALHYAALKGNARAVELLLEYGADSSIKNIKGTTALDVATTPQVRRLLRTT